MMSELSSNLLKRSNLQFTNQKPFGTWPLGKVWPTLCFNDWSFENLLNFFLLPQFFWREKAREDPGKASPLVH